MCITQMVGDKARWLAERECSLPWPVFGVPDRIGVDNAKEFKSRSLKNACREWGVRLEYRPIGAPHYGGHVERLIGTMMGGVHLLRGSTQSSVKEKGDYDSVAHATMTLTEFEKWLALEIGRYNHAVHRVLNRPPIAVWREMEGWAAWQPFQRSSVKMPFLYRFSA